MVAYEFYWHDEIGKEHLVGILPERRRNPIRITEESVIKWGRMLSDDWADSKSIFFKKVTIGENTGRFFRFNISLRRIKK